MATGVLHQYTPRLVAFEYGTATHDNVLLFVGGLGDGLETVPYVPLLADKLAPMGWSVAQVLISSSYRGWGTGTLARDADEIAQAVDYFRRRKPAGSKIALMGHSTGCQDTMQLLVRRSSSSDSTSPLLSGAILQAPVSDREAMHLLFPDQAAPLLTYALAQQAAGNGAEILPKRYSDLFFDTPITADRWISLAKKEGDDDFFSSDLDDTVLSSTFGAVSCPLLVLVSGADEFMPAEVSKPDLVGRWKRFVKPEYWAEKSGVVAGGRHNLGPGSASDAAEDAIARVAAFLSSL
ncbi:hypothetical protein BZA70DRAFT_285028 [Myxozyma melibiosi]|uniref:DUF1749-domain-containing protein n=1 Tax=Myxozyma melibiosi TaxID=54550 RepID=A0ABR1F136_9ASCO